jgi:transposase
VEVVYRACCGLDVHKRRVVACVLASEGGEPPRKAVRTFGTLTDELLALGDWLAGQGVTHVAMESTGVYWQPIWNLLEGRFELVLANAQHIKAVPGRKTDVKDSEWIAQLLRHGLVKASFVPDRPQRELRELTRYRTGLVQERAREVNRLQKTLEGANIKLASVASDVLGVSGRQMLEGLVAGQAAAPALAELAKGRLRDKLPELERALVGVVGPHQRFLLARQLAHIDFLDASLAEVGAEVAERLRPFADELARLQTIPGVKRRTAETLVAELGVDMRRFPSDRQAAAWAGVCPGNDESAGKRRPAQARQGNPALRAALVEAGQAAGRSKETYLGAQFRRLAARRGPKRAALAVAHSILVIAYHLLKERTTYRERGPDSFDRRDRHATELALVRRLEALGNTVTLTPKPSGEVA